MGVASGERRNRTILKLFEASALRMDAASQILWEHFLRYSEKTGEVYLDLENEQACAFMNLLFHQEELRVTWYLDDAHSGRR